MNSVFFYVIFILFIVACIIFTYFALKKKKVFREKVRFSKTVLITGGSAGIGLELAKLFCEDEYNICIAARKMESMKDAKEKLLKINKKCTVHLFSVDLCKKDGPETLIKQLKEKGLEINCLVNNAGYGFNGPFIKFPLVNYENLTNINCLSCVKLSYFLLPKMIERKEGMILNVGSLAGQMAGIPYQAIYGASKSYLRFFSMCLSNEVGKYGIKVSIMQPGYTETKFVKSHGFGKVFGLKLIKNFFGGIDKPDAVALEGYEALLRGDSNVITGRLNKLLYLSTIFIPEKFYNWIVKGWGGIKKKK